MKKSLFTIVILIAMMTSQASAQDLAKSTEEASLPVAYFFAADYAICAGESVQFLDSSVNNPTSWLWTFSGAAPLSTMQHPVITFTAAGKVSVVLQVSNTSGSSTSAKLGMITVHPCTGLDNQQSDIDFTVFPNPARSFITLQSNSVLSYNIHDPLGKLITSGLTKANEPSRINLLDSTSGIYFLTVREGNRSKTVKIIKD